MIIKIRPHHFFDVIKLYGKGIDHFVPDKYYHHDFYKIANEIVGNDQLELFLTVGADDICGPCKYQGINKKCEDTISHIVGIGSKDRWNEIIDRRIIEKTRIGDERKIAAKEYCRILLDHIEMVYRVWEEESEGQKITRYEAFLNGAKKYLMAG
jgi:hypothetical protein